MSRWKPEIFLIISTIILLSVLITTRAGEFCHENTPTKESLSKKTEEPQQTTNARGENLPHNAASYLQKARILESLQNFEEAYPYFVTARLFAYFDGETENEYWALKGQSECAFWAGEIDTCIYRSKQALDLARQLNDTIEEYQMYAQLKQAYVRKVDMKRASQMQQKLDSIGRIVNDKTVFLQNLYQFSNDAFQQNNIKLAEQYLLEAESVMGTMTPQERMGAEVFILPALRNLYHASHNFDKARKYSRKYINVAKKAFGETQLAYMSTYYAEALICSDQKDREGAYVALDSMYYGLTLEGGESTRNKMTYYNLRGIVCSKFGEWKSAAESYRKALAVIKGSPVDGGAEKYNTLMSLGGSLYQMRNYDEALDCYKEYAAFCKYQYGEVSVDYSHALSCLAEVERCRGRVEAGKQYYIKAVDIFKKIVREQFSFVSTQKWGSFWTVFAPKLWAMTAYAMMIGENNSVFTKKCYDALLFSKALLLEADRSMAKEIEAKCSKKEQQMYYEMLNLQGQLKGLMNDYEKNKENISSLHRQISDLDKQMTPIISKLDYTSFLELDYHDIQQSLEENEVLLDFADYIDGNEDNQHVAFVISKNQKYPKIIKGFTEQDLKRLLIGKRKDSLYKAPIAEKALELIWKPLANVVKGKSVIYYVPSGVLHQIAIESIPLHDGSLLGDHYRFIRLSSAREIANLKSLHKSGAKTTAVLFGGLKYDMDTKVMANEASHYKANRQFGMRNSNVARGNRKFDELPNTQKEIDEISNILKKKGVSVSAQTGTKGTEEAFLSMNGKAPAILHVATHGFYYTPEEAKGVTYLNGYNDAMMLSGLVLSGGNLAWTGKQLPEGVLGGVLTANTIATLDLKRTDLVVLSACQTGLGLTTPEGIYGLQRAFKKAGVQTIVMTLWSVDDEATKDFMIKFYEELANDNKWDKREAFEKAKAFVRNKSYIRGGKQCKGDPHFWAGFVMLD